MDDQKIDKILELFQTYNSVIREGVIRLKVGLIDSKLIDRAHVLGLIDDVNKRKELPRSFTLTVFGHEVIRHGSWTKYQKHIHDKAINDAKNSAYLTKTRWWPLSISVVGLIVSIISLTRTCSNKEESGTQLDKQTQGHEVEEYVPRTNPTDSSTDSSTTDSLP